MKNLGLIFYIVAFVVVAVAVSACGSAATNTANTNVRNANANANTAVLVNANNSNVGVASRTSNSNITREEYDRDRANYERDKGDSKIGTGANDGWIWFKTRAALATEAELRDSTVNVDVENNVITLRGTVASAAQKAAAEKIAKGIEGQTGVKNQLQVKAGDSLGNQMTGSGNDREANRSANANRRP